MNQSPDTLFFHQETTVDDAIPTGPDETRTARELFDIDSDMSSNRISR